MRLGSEETPREDEYRPWPDPLCWAQILSSQNSGGHRGGPQGLEMYPWDTGLSDVARSNFS